MISIELEMNKTQAENCWRLAVPLHPVELHGKVGHISHTDQHAESLNISPCCFFERNLDVLRPPGAQEGNLTT